MARLARAVRIRNFVKHQHEACAADLRGRIATASGLAEAACEAFLKALAAIGQRLQCSDEPAPLAAASTPASAEDLRALGLTPREAEVLFWVTQGKTNEDAMAILGASLWTVKKHLGRIDDKPGVENPTAAAQAALRARPGAVLP